MIGPYCRSAALWHLVLPTCIVAWHYSLLLRHVVRALGSRKLSFHMTAQLHQRALTTAAEAHVTAFACRCTRRCATPRS